MIKTKHHSVKLLFKPVLIIIFTLCVLVSFFYFRNNNNNCHNPFEVKDFTSGKETVRICNNTVYRGATKVVGKNEYPDLFEFLLNKDSKPENVQQYIRVFERDKQEYVSMKSVIDYSSWLNSSIGIYRKEGNKYTLIFKKAFADNQGRWANIEFGEDSSYVLPPFYSAFSGEGITISGDIGTLGCVGRCRLLWWDFYDWDSNAKTFVLSNNKHQESFKKLLADYKIHDETICFDEAEVKESISTLYLVRKDKQKLCSDTAEVPYTTPQEAEMLIKGITAINRIINGENISMSQVKDVKIDK